MLTPKSTEHALLILAIGLGMSAANAQTVVLDQAQAWEMARQKGWVVRAETDAGVMELQAIVNGIPRYYITHNAVAADSISTDECLPGGSSGLGLTGSGVTLGVWDADGVRTSHQEFGGRAIQKDYPGSTHYHPTHIAGTMIASGFDASAKGMSPAAYLNCYDWNSDYDEMQAAAALDELRVSNHSYGFATGWRFDDDDGYWYWYGDVTVSTVEDNRFGLYTSDTQELDHIAYEYPYYLICKSAGNDRDEDGPGPGGGHYYIDPVTEDWAWSTDTRDPDGSYDCIGTKGSAKNILTVAAVEDVPGGYSGPGGVTMSSFSSWGPIDDGRIKPDILGNGVGLYSAGDGSDSDYTTLSGTSMSTPNVSGSLGLLIEHWHATHPSESDMRSSTLKGLVLHTADEVGPGNGPDYMFGWGLMNTVKAASAISLDADNPLTISELTISDGGTFELPVSTDGSSSELRATICWTDPPGTPPGNLLNPPDKMLVNDLDLRIERASPEATYDPWVLDPSDPGSPATTGDNDTDNVEQVVVYSPGASAFTVRVTHKGGLSGGSQDFSLFISGMVSPEVLTVNITGQGDVALDPPGGVYAPGTTVELTAQAARGWAFDHWEGHLTGSNNPETLVIDEDKVVTAVFTFVGGLVIYVDDDAPEGGNCESWATACKYLQDALAMALSDPAVVEIRVAAGVYTPDQDELGIVTSGDREATFELISGVAIYGGYAGLANPDEPRDPISYVTTLSGDLDRDDKSFAPDPLESNCCEPDPTRLGCDNQECQDMVCEVPDYTYCCMSPFMGWDEGCVDQANVLCVGVCVDGDNLENSYHVVTAGGTDATALLDGFTVTAGNADYPPPPQGEPPSMYRYGAGLYSEDGSPTLANCIFAGNVAVDAGGGIYFDNGTPMLTDCQLNDNNAVNRGGGLYNEGGNPTLTRCTFTDNSATQDGGGVYSLGAETPNPTSQLTLTDCEFNGNQADRGAGLALKTYALATLSRCSFSGNNSWLQGGGVRLDDHSNATFQPQCHFAQNTAHGGAGGGAGAVENYSVATFHDAVFTANEAVSSGGALRMENHSEASFYDCTFDGNSADGDGGALFVNTGSMLTVEGGTISNNTAVTGSGGGVGTEKNPEGASLTIKDCSITGNYAWKSGGGIYVQKEDSLYLDNCTIELNRVEPEPLTHGGGGIYCGGSPGEQRIVNTVIRANEAWQGAGIDVAWGTVLIQDCTIAENAASGVGGGVHGGSGVYPEIQRCHIEGNSAGSGGGIYIWIGSSTKPVSIRNTLVADNTAGAGDGGGIWHGDGYVDVTNCTIANNSAGGNGGGFHGDSPLLDSNIVNTIFWDNLAADGPQIWASGDTAVRFSDIQGGQGAVGGDGNVSWLEGSIDPPADPEFVDPDGAGGNPDYRLDDDIPSPCIDAGDNSVIEHLALDLDRAPRIANCLVDMGAYESHVEDPGWENPGDPGLVVVMDEPPVPARFQVPLESVYMFSYDPDRISLWEDPERQAPIPPGVVFEAGTPDTGCAVDLVGFLALQRCFTYESGGPVDEVCDSFDLDGDDDVGLTDYDSLQPAAEAPICNTVPVYVEGTGVSSELGDAPVTLLVRHQGTSEFVPEEKQRVTVASIDITPSSGGLGTPLTITLQPAIPPLAFNAATTADWDGVYQPSVGDPTAPFQVAYNANQFRESSQSQSVLVAGDGTITDAPAFEDLEGSGSADGVFTFNLSGLSVQRSHDFGLEVSGAVWEVVDYPYNGAAPPSIAGEPETLPVMGLSNTPDPLNPDEELLFAVDSFHIAVVVRIEGTDDPATACDDPPATIRVDLVSYDASDCEIDRIRDLALTKVPEDDGHPNHFVYHNNLDKPIVLLDVDLDEAQYPTVIPFHVVAGGSAVIVATTQ